MTFFTCSSLQESRFLLLFVIVSLAFLLTSCSETTLTPVEPRHEDEEIGAPESGEPLPSDVRLRIQYDQTEVTYSNVWPGSIVGNDSKSMEEGAKLMTEFERIHEVRSYDEEGYMSASYEYLEGHPDMNMPEDAYSDLKDEMPYDPEDENPIVRYELDGGTMEYLREDGTVDRTFSVDPETFRIDPAALDSLEEVAEDSSDVDARREAVRGSLERRGLSLRQIDENRVGFTRELDEEHGAEQLRTVVDLRIGKPIYLKYELEDGRTDMIETRQYTHENGMPVMRKSVTYNYDDRTGDWKVVNRTDVTRENITVQFN